MEQAEVRLRGTQHGLVLTLGDGDWDELLQKTAEQLSSRPSFFRGARVIADVGPRILDASQLIALGECLVEHQILLWAVRTTSERTREAARALGLETEPPTSVAGSRHSPADHGLVINRTLRSGQAVQHDGHIIVLGDVNPGAEIIAGGHVIVWGRLRGTVHAGASGDPNAVVCALRLQPTQLRIGKCIARRPEDETAPPTGPEIARLVGNRVIVEPWIKEEEK